jgi:hypothetical protein
MLLDVSTQVITRVKSSPFFSLQIDESTDIEKAHLLTYVRYVFKNEFNEELLFCKPLETNTTGNEIFKVWTNFSLKMILFGVIVSVLHLTRRDQ